MDFLKFLINLDERKDRLEESIIEINKMGFEQVNKFSAIKATPGMFGCTLSHLYCLGISRNSNRHALMLEDDIKFINDYKEIYAKSLSELESLDGWDMWYLGGNICNKIEQVSPHLGRLSHSQSTHAYAVNYNFIDTLLNVIPRVYGKPLDLVYAENIIPRTRCYITIPMIAVQRPSFSDIEGQYADYTTWMEGRFYSNLIPKTS